LPSGNDWAVGQIKELILGKCGFTFTADRLETLASALKKRISKRNLSSSEAYYTLLLKDQDELNSLVELLTVNETYFFREPGHLKLVIETLVPEFLSRRDSAPVRILSAGCSTGEEPYSIAMLLNERYGPSSRQQFNITGVDIDSKAVANARNGLYGKSSFRGVDPAMLKRYFEPAGPELHRICDAIKGQVRFEVVNLLDYLQSTGLGKLDIIFYRNVSIYFPPDVQKKIFGSLAELLNDGGALIVGASETLHHDLGILSLVQCNGLFYYGKQPLLSIADRRATRRSPEPPARQDKTPHLHQSHEFVRPQAEKARPVPPKPVTPKTEPGAADPKRQFDLALAKARENRHDEALEILEAIISADRSFVQAHGLKASLLLNIARHDDALGASETMLELDPLCREAYLMLGIIARHRGDDNEAFKRFREALFIDSSCWVAHFYTAEIMYTRKEGKRARSSYESVLRLLEKGSQADPGKAFFPLSFNVQQYISICRHKLSLLKEYR